jgi:hypothetical protein
LGLLLAGALLFMLLARMNPLLLSGTTLALAGMLALCTEISHQTGEIVPDGDRVGSGKITDIAYVDGTHLGRYDNESWRADGTMGLMMTLVRNGYMSLELREFTRERLERAGLLVSIAPSRSFSREECEVVRDFVKGGGIFILTASYHDRAASREILETFGFEIGRIDTAPIREPQPMGHFRAPYLNTGTYMTQVRLHEAWPVSCTAADAPPADWTQQEGFDEWTLQRVAGWILGRTLAPMFPFAQPTNPARVLAYGTGNRPAMLMRRIGKGAVVVVGDSAFPLNKNLEIEGGQPFGGLRENPHFWRWLLSDLRKDPQNPQVWTPPPPTPETPR